MCGEVYGFGYGVAKDERLSFMYTEKAAKQGDMMNQHNTGIHQVIQQAESIQQLLIHHMHKWHFIVHPL